MADQLNYADYDFDAIVSQIQDRLALKGSWLDTYKSGTGQMLIEFHAYVLNQVMWYIERAAQESYLMTARNKSSIINLVRLLGYIPKRATSASGYATFSIPTAHTANIFIPKYTVISTNSAISYYVTTDATLLVGALDVIASIKQGIVNSLQITSDGSLNQEYQLLYTDIEENGIEVTVNGIPWTAVDSFVLGTPTSTYYRIIPNLDDTITVVFGDNVNARAPGSGDAIVIRYVTTAGVGGNVYTAGSISNIDSSIFDADEVKITTVTVSNADVVIGGDAAESIEEIRDEAPRVFATGDRAVTRADYRAILDNYAGVATSNAWGENEENPPNYTMFNRVKICLVLQGWNLPSTTFKQALSDYLYTKAQLTVKYTYVDPTIVDIVPTLDVYAVKGSTLSTVQSAVDDVLSAQFELGSTTKLGIPKRIGDVIASVEAVSNVSYSHVILKVSKTLSASYESGHTAGALADLLPIKIHTVGLYVNSDLVGYDDGEGVFVDVSSALSVTGTVDYITGETIVDVSPGLAPTDVVTIRYEQDTQGDIVVGENQIAKLLEVDITSIQYDV